MSVDLPSESTELTLAYRGTAVADNGRGGSAVGPLMAKQVIQICDIQCDSMEFKSLSSTVLSRAVQIGLLNRLRFCGLERDWS